MTPKTQSILLSILNRAILVYKDDKIIKQLLKQIPERELQELRAAKTINFIN